MNYIYCIWSSQLGVLTCEFTVEWLPHQQTCLSPLISLSKESFFFFPSLTSFLSAPFSFSLCFLLQQEHLPPALFLCSYCKCTSWYCSLQSLCHMPSSQNPHMQHKWHFLPFLQMSAILSISLLWFLLQLTTLHISTYNYFPAVKNKI